MTRPANAVDFWRGVALITIFINHIPGIFYQNITHRNVSLSDSAELFVFLAGWSLRYVVGRPNDPTPASQLMLRLGGRAFTLYAAHMLIVMIAIAMLATAARVLENPILLEWHNAAPVFFEPATTHIGLVLLSHQLGYFDILPLYVVLLLLAPGIALLHRTAPNWLLPISFMVYVTALVFQITVPTWPTEGQWFFNPLCWQFIFVLGFSFSREYGPGGWARRNISWIRRIAWPIVIAGGIFAWFGSGWIDPTKVPEPKLLFINGKTFLTPIRLIQFLALVAALSVIYPSIERATPQFVTFSAMLGRNSLHAFCAGSVLSLAGQIIRFYFKGGILIDTVLVVSGIVSMGVIAWVVEWRDRSK
ncbi:MAG: OpgC domain-containing protein [Hyphomicrobiaceae bacterium]|nr:OpgC domain-containing protein [Hyphomicrobiaceae bacterium]